MKKFYRRGDGCGRDGKIYKSCIENYKPKSKVCELGDKIYELSGDICKSSDEIYEPKGEVYREFFMYIANRSFRLVIFAARSSKVSMSSFRSLAKFSVLQTNSR